jgi:hypothetical protein
MIDANTVRLEIEYSVGWINANPALFVASLLKFYDAVEAKAFKNYIDISRKGFIKFYAKPLA